VVANGEDANVIGENSVKEVIGESLQIRAPQIPDVRVKPQRIDGGGFNTRRQFMPELVSEAIRQFVVTA
jgi:hypothetical protein